MKQPDNVLVSFFDDDDWWVDVRSSPNDGGMCEVGIGLGKTRKSALKAARRRLLNLIKVIDKRLEKMER